MGESSTIAAREAEIIEAFALLDSWEEKYEYIIELGKKLPPLDERYKLAENIIKGCQSTVWLVANYSDGKVFFKADSDAVIVKGLVSLLIKVLSGVTPQEILQAQLDFLQEIGMMTHLAQTRSNGLRAMIQQMKHYALAFQSINS
ncbi:MAG: SufE family protein [Hydrotalea flava]|uniref:SufE family protein n=1 Tax=Hydrotalea TaxID=1004300 RepID=UPI0008299888|nr:MULTISPECIES: SufE family protein [Hydrotalea]RTL54261.1 MAG: SufE family protein [Sphingobacteriales bacterium]MBY0348582.1 SufE family protein [Hydrotalea flava]NIM36211.1 SufE family protein [Hydrotalea flava]NIM39062.1 SufE family protein [Hydrotalea flava]NIN04297.1 SufE family protein [Hydrotalea flava]